MLDIILENLVTQLPLTVLVILSSWVICNYLRTPKNLPPGPWSLPLVGFLPFMGNKPHVTLANLRKDFGEVITIYLGPHRAIVLNSFNAVKTALVKQADVFSGRKSDLIPYQFRYTPGIVLNTGENWAEIRRFSQSTLREFGFGQSILETRIKDEIEPFIKEVETTKGKPTDIGDSLRMSMINVICSIIIGRRCEYDDPFIIKLVELCGAHIRSVGFHNIETVLPDCIRKPGLLKFLGIAIGMQPVLQIQEILTAVIESVDKVHQLGNKDSFIDAWLTEMEREETNLQFFNRNQLPVVLSDLVIAGSDTTSHTMRWVLLYMMKYPDVQSKIQQEIDDVIGPERTPTMTDQKAMPYTEATLMEVARIATIVPLSIAHSTEKDTTLNGYFIPEGTLVFPNLWAVHHDPDTFPDPHEFKPERFLTDKQQIKKMEELIPFSMGKRLCLGESMARMELFLYFTSILQRFSIQKVEGTEVTFDHFFAVMSVPKPYKLCAITR